MGPSVVCSLACFSTIYLRPTHPNPVPRNPHRSSIHHQNNRTLTAPPTHIHTYTTSHLRTLTIIRRKAPLHAPQLPIPPIIRTPRLLRYSYAIALLKTKIALALSLKRIQRHYIHAALRRAQ